MVVAKHKPWQESGIVRLPMSVAMSAIQGANPWYPHMIARLKVETLKVFRS